MDRLTALVGELEAMLERLRARLPVCPFDPKAPKNELQPGDLCPVCLDYGDERSKNLCRGADTRVMDEAADAIDTLLATLKAQRKALEPFVEAMRDFEAECFFGCLGEKEAGVIYPDETRFALVHSVDNAPRFNGGRTMDDAPDEEFGDIGSFTLGDLRRACASIEGNPTA